MEKNQSEFLGLYLPAKLKLTLAERARRNHRSLSGEVRALIEQAAAVQPASPGATAGAD